jgi:hypothetical protein
MYMTTTVGSKSVKNSELNRIAKKVLCKKT